MILSIIFLSYMFTPKDVETNFFIMDYYYFIHYHFHHLIPLSNFIDYLCYFDTISYLIKNHFIIYLFCHNILGTVLSFIISFKIINSLTINFYHVKSFLINFLIIHYFINCSNFEFLMIINLNFLILNPSFSYFKIIIFSI